MNYADRTVRPAPVTDAGRKFAPLAYTLPNAAAVSGLSRSTLYRHAAAGRLRLVRVGGRTLVDAASLRCLLGTAA